MPSVPFPFPQRGMQNADDLLRHNEVKACEREAALPICQAESSGEIGMRRRMTG